MSMLARLLKDGIKIHSTRPPQPVTPTKLTIDEQELKDMIPKRYTRDIEKGKKDAEEGIVKDQIDMKILKFREQRSKDVLEDKKKLDTTQSSIRNIKVSDRIHAGLVNLFMNGKLKDPRLLLTDFHVCQVHLTPARTKVIVQWSLLNGPDCDRVASVDRALDDNKKIIGHLINQTVPMKFQPHYLFEFKENVFDAN